MNPISAVDNAISLVGRLRVISKKIGEAEFRAILADLTMELADAKTAIAGLKLENLELRERCEALENQRDVALEKKMVKYGCYQFEDNPEQLFCPNCYDTKGKRHLTNRKSIRERVCTVCRVVMYT